MGFFRRLHAWQQARPPLEPQALVPQPTSPGRRRKSHEKEQEQSKLSDLQRFEQKLTLRTVARFWAVLSQAVLQRGKATEDLDLATFVELMKQVLPREDPFDATLLTLLFDRIDRRRQSWLKATDVATGLVLLCAADNFDKMRTLFGIFDTDDDHCLSQDEIFQLYLAIRRNTLAKERSEMVADIVFDDELALQTARRLYERTVESMRGKVSLDLLVYDEFAKLPFIADVFRDLFPVTFTLEFALREYRPERVVDGPLALVEETKKAFRKNLRRGLETLKLDQPGQGLRIMSSMLAQPNLMHTTHEVGTKPLPKLGASKRGSARMLHVRSSLDDDDDEAPRPAPAARGQRATHQVHDAPDRHHARHEYSIEKVDAELCERELPTVTLSHPNGIRFRSMPWNEKSAQVYADKEVKRRFKFTCVLCNAPHDLNLSRAHEQVRGRGGEDQG